MGTTLTEAVTVPEARRRLQDTRRMSSEQVDELQKVIDRFLSARPRNQQCVACGSMIWSEHTTADGDARWACSGCHRHSALTQDEWWAQSQAAAAVRKVQEAREAAAAPAPRDALLEAQAARADVVAHLAKLEPGLVAARAALAVAQVRHDSAVATVAEAEQAAITRLAASVMGTRPEAAAITQARV